MEIRTAIIDDAETILVLQRLAYQSEAVNYDFTIRPLTETLEDIRDRFHDRRFLKAIEDGQIVGSVRAFQDDEACHVERLVVHPDYQRRGIGMALLNMIETCFPAARRFELFAGQKSESNIRLYERAGYRVVRQERINEKVSFVVMEKTVAAAEKTDRPACPVCGGPLQDIRRKLCCVQCHSIIETCCD